jgi:uncharacterized repeat protein (TIGR03803 family)
MKKTFILLSTLLACLPLLLFSQTTFYGLTPSGGSTGGGAIIKYESGTNTISSEFNFPNEPKYPATYAAPLQASNGKLYGMTRSGGGGYGTIFSFDPISNTEVQLLNFNNSDGAFPIGSLVQATNGKLYGMTNNGGSDNKGVLFSFDISTNVLVKLVDFTGANGTYPSGSLVQANNGKLYGMTQTGGFNGVGTMFSFDPATNNMNHLLDFDNLNGAFPTGRLIQIDNGKLYGLTTSGGVEGSGTLFSFDPVTNNQEKLYDFINAANAFPHGSPVQAGNGKLYGMTGGGINGSGTIFSFDPSTNIQTQLFDFDGNNGAYPNGDLTKAIDGKLYGMTPYGGSDGLGTIFSFDPSTNIQAKLVDFTGINGTNPYGSLVSASNGILYGMTSYGGINGSGTIFSFNPSANIQASLFSFNTNNTNSASPSGSLVKAANSKFYGISTNGGTADKGTIFSYDISMHQQVKAVDFTGANGAYPSSGTLVDGGNGKFYGTTTFGGSYNYGVIFSFDPSTNTQTNLFDFSYTNGSYPDGSLVKASNGKLYGTTQGGGNVGYGTLFSFDPVNNTQTRLFDFNFSTGAFPSGGMIQATNGLLYGMTSSSGDNIGSGSIYSFDPSNNTYAQVFEFNGDNGSFPLGYLMQASDEKIYGTTTYSRNDFSHTTGTLFSFDPLTNTHVKLQDFTGTNGGNPNGRLTQASDGKLYGTTAGGGNNDKGVVYSYDISTGLFTKLQDFNGTNGASPFYGAALIEVDTGVPPVVKMITPVSTATFDAGSTITIRARATDADGTVIKTELFINGNFYKTDSTSPYLFRIPNAEPGIYKLTVKATDNTGLSAISDTTVVTVTACQGSGKISFEKFSNIKGSQIADLTNNHAYPGKPKVTAALNRFEYVNMGDNYGARMRGYICAPVTGRYVFSISGDDQAILYLSRDKNPGNKMLIAYTPAATKFREWDKFSTQKSAPVLLVKGATYYIETLHKEATCTDHLSVAWTIPGGAFEGPIPGSRLSPWTSSSSHFAQRSSESEMEINNGIDGLQVTVMPNPSSSYFTIKIASNINKTVSIKVIDATGRMVESKPNAAPNSAIQVGNTLTAGIYFAEIIQDGEKQILKLVKK